MLCLFLVVKRSSFVLRALGSEVAQLVRHGGVLRSFDEVLGRQLVEHMGAAGIDMVTGAVPKSVRSGEDGLAVRSAGAGAVRR